MFYMGIAKHLLYLKNLKLTNGYERRYGRQGQLDLKGRHKIIFDELTWGIDIYSDSQEEYNKYFDLLESCIISYRAMLGDPIHFKEQKELPVEEVKSDTKEKVS